MLATTRFAPSPTGPLHLGHAFAAMVANARAGGGRFLLRIEDIDQSRARSDWEKAILADLAWLGLDWQPPLLRQSERLEAYACALDELWAAGVLYPCMCSRRDILTALGAPQEGAPMGPDGVIYPGTCRPLPRPARRPPGAVLRLDMAATLARFGVPTGWQEIGIGAGWQSVDAALYLHQIGDVVLARREFATSYHLAVVVDDAHQGITEITRGADLAEATPIHLLLQHCLGLPQPIWHHHRLIRDDTGKRLAKRDDARALTTFRSEGRGVADIKAMLGWSG